jgi:hypothetical protein
LDVTNAFLHSELKETVYCQQPTGFVDGEHPDHVCLLDKSLYGLHQAPIAWYQHFATHLRSLGFVTTGSDTSLFVLRRGADTAWLLLYVDDIVFTTSSSVLLHRIIHELCGAVAMKDLGPLHYLGSRYGARRMGSSFTSSSTPRTSWTVLACSTASRHQGQGLHGGRRSSHKQGILPQYRWRPSVPNTHQTGAGVCRAVGMSSYARSSRRPLEHHQTRSALRPRNFQPWRLAPRILVHSTNGIH